MRARSLRVEALEPRIVLDAGPQISEFMAVNDAALMDGDNNFSDWIEIHNPTNETIELDDWYLTDNDGNLDKWRFPDPTLDPDITIPPGGYLVVFASNGRELVPDAEDPDWDPAGNLHTDFKLGGSGEYLALVQPDGTTVADEYAPEYPNQYGDVSYGMYAAGEPFQELLVAEFALATAFVPTDDSLGLDWVWPGFDDTGWASNPAGVGFDLDPDYEDLINLDVHGAMFDERPGVYVRFEFQVDDPTDFDSLLLQMKYDDGFVAYLNGIPVADANAPLEPTANDVATAEHTGAPAMAFEDFDLSDDVDLLNVGTNVLAIHGLNSAVDSPDMLVLPKLIGSGVSDAEVPAYFLSPTPGEANNEGVAVPGPAVTQVTQDPPPPTENEDLVVTALVLETRDPVNEVKLYYRVMYGAEVALTMRDDGTGGDAVAGDNVFSATIPSSAYSAGQMVRWRVTATDDDNTLTKQPLFLDPLDSPEYFGTVVVDPSVVSNLPVLHWFVQNPSAANNRTGTRGSMFFDGQFYDNIKTDLHGQSSGGFPKKSYDVDFNQGFRFRLADDQPLLKDFNLLSNWADKTKTRNTIGYGAYADIGAPHHFVQTVRVQQNGQFFSTADLVEDGDDRYLERLGLDPNGALYKMYNNLTSVGNNEKKTRKWEGTADLQALVDGASLTPNSTAQRQFYYDNLNIPEFMNYLPVFPVTGNHDCCHKNYYMYRDSDGTGEWSMLPWDVDLSMGHQWNSSETYYDDDMVTNLTIFRGANNIVSDLYAMPEIREMYLRRLRSVMDELLQPPGTPEAELKFEARMDEIAAQIGADADLDYQKWRSWTDKDLPNYQFEEDGGGLRYHYSTEQMLDAIDRVHDTYYPQRRAYMYGQTVDNGGEIPLPQPDIGALPAELRLIDFGSIEFKPASGNPDEEYIEIINKNSFAVDISGWRLTGGVDFTFAPGTVIPSTNHPGYNRLFVSPDVKVFRARAEGPSGSQERLVVGGYDGHLSAWGETVRLEDAAGAEIVSTTYVGAPSPVQEYLKITEVMYNPPDPTPAEFAAGFTDNDYFEYIEFVNTSDQTLDLSGSFFNSGVTFTFGAVTLESGQRAVVVKDQGAFEFRYGTGPTVIGQFLAGSLDNGGERLKLEDAFSETVLDFTYNDSNAWPGKADGRGGSLEVIELAGDYDDGDNWMSSDYGGSPGGPAVFPTVDVIVNEVLTHTDLPQVDSIELYNTTQGAINIGGWYLSDSWGLDTNPDTGDYQKFRIPDNTWIPAGGYLVFDEDDFNQSLGADPKDFALSGSHGDDVWLMRADASGHITHFADHVEFGAALNGESFGRWPDGSGVLYPMTGVTLDPPNNENSGPRVGPLVISEVMYHPTPPAAEDLAIYPELTEDDLEFIEIYNPTGDAVNLKNWRIRGGIDFDFPTDQDFFLADGVALVILPFNPDKQDEFGQPVNEERTNAFRLHYGLDPITPLVGGYKGQLDNAGERVQLQRPDTPPADEPDFIPRLLEDQVVYENTVPWPANPDGGGNSLTRDLPAQWGHSADSWSAAPPTPGSIETPYVDVIVNEVLSRPGAGGLDAIELHNTTGNDINIGGWLLSDNWDFLSNDFTRFEIPLGTEILAGGYVWFDEDDFNSSGGTDPDDFELDGWHGDQVFLLQPGAGGGSTRLAEHVVFGPAAEGESWGRWPDGDGDFYPMIGTTFGNPNSGVRVGPVIVNEIMYHATPPTPQDLAFYPQLTKDDLEYIEIYNPTSEVLDLTGWRIRGGIQFDFPAGTEIGPGLTLTVLRFDPAESDRADAFRSHYQLDPVYPLVGGFTGLLDNAGDRLQLLRPDGPPPGEQDLVYLLEDPVLYDDAAPWPTEADGGGKSLTRLLPAGWGYEATSWEAADPTPDLLSPYVDVVVNEVLTHPDVTQTDAIELHNASPAPVDVGGWYLTDSWVYGYDLAAGGFPKFRIPDGTVIPAGGYVVFDESHFYSSGGGDPSDFQLDGYHGDEVWLLQATPAGIFERVADRVEFGAAAEGESLGRWPNGTGDFHAMTANTFGDTNSVPRVGPVVIGEVMYHPSAPTAQDLGAYPDLTKDDLEYIEIHNPGPGEADLTGWQLRGGVEYDFPELVIPERQTRIILSFDPELDTDRFKGFMSHYSVHPGLVNFYLGGYSGTLDDGGERIQLLRPDEPPPDEPDFVPMLVEDDVFYDEAAPWPDASSTGQSLTRYAPAEWGHDPTRWTAANPTIPSGIPPNFSLPVNPLSVVEYTPTASGVELRFNRDVDPSELSLYDVETGILGPADFTLVGDSVGGVSGTLVVDGDTVTFITTGGPLQADDYTFTLRGAADGFKDTYGYELDGDNDGTAGGDFVGTFSAAPEAVVVGLRDFSRGPGQAVNVPATGDGLPLTLNDGRAGGPGIESLEVTIAYDPFRLDVTGAELGDDAPAGASVTADFGTWGQVTLSFSSPTTPLIGGVFELAILTLGLLDAADYGSTGGLNLTGLAIADTTDAPVAATADSAAYVAAYFGDATGNGAYSGLDAQRVARVAVGVDSGLEEFPIADPVIVGDITGNGALSGLDAQKIALVAVGIDVPEIPPWQGPQRLSGGGDSRERRAESGEPEAAVGDRLSVISYELSVISYELSVISYQLSVNGDQYPQPVSAVPHSAFRIPHSTDVPPPPSMLFVPDDDVIDIPFDPAESGDSEDQPETIQEAIDEFFATF